ncbi:ABC transporter permease [Sporosarcina sp. NPDC096371]|uniref:ABC transporter permease n=1 Tax=Sporosarcina sp. NPDC096371 TaxID=3364530 RepID=UPI003803B5D4
MNVTILKQTVRANYKLWIIFTVVLSVLNAVLIAVFEPSTLTNMADMVKDTPLASLLGDTSFLGMLAQTFYSIHGVILPLIFIIMTANSLVASQVDKGSMAYLLSTPIKRTTVVRTQALYLITAISTMFVIVTLAGIVAIHVSQGELGTYIADYIALNVGLFLLMFATSGISFMFSCIFNLSKHSLALGAGIPVVFFLFHLMAQVSDSLEGLKYLSVNTLFDTAAILSGESFWLQFTILGIVGIVIYIIGIRFFGKKDLPL